MNFVNTFIWLVGICVLYYPISTFAKYPIRGGTDTTSLVLTSSAFSKNSEIPTRNTCEGENVSPPLTWSGIPPEAKGLALIVEDPDAPDPQAPKHIFVHWILYNLPPNNSFLSEGIQPSELPKGTLEGKNDWQRTGYGGPCPPIGRHRYFFRIYVLDTLLPDLHQPTKAQLEQAMQGHTVASSELVGTYQKKKR